MQKFGYPETLLKEYENWVTLLKPKQTTLGTIVIASKTSETYLGELSSEAWAEFAQVSSDVELTLINELGAEKFNYLALMMKDPNVHFHVVPRYSKPVRFNSHEFKDSDWPGKTELGEIEMDDQTFSYLLNDLKEKYNES